MTPVIYEGLVYGTISIWKVPKTFYDGAFVYIMATPLVYYLQWRCLGANIKFNSPILLGGYDGT